MKSPHDKAPSNHKKAVSDWLVSQGMKRGEANKLAKTTEQNATYHDVAQAVTSGLKE